MRPGRRRPRPPHRRPSPTAAAVLLAAAASLALAGCAGPARTPDGGVAPPARADVRRAPPERWQALGKVGVRTAGSGWTSALFDWRQAHERFRLRLSGAFGQGAVQVAGGPGGVALTTAAGERVLAATPEEALERETGWRLPASSLRYWMTGSARPGAPVAGVEWDGGGRLARFEQQGWSVEYRYGRGAEGEAEPGARALPARLTARAEGFAVRVVVRDWRLPGAPP